MNTTTHRPLSEIAAEIRLNWTVPHFGALPYLEALETLHTIDDSYGEDPAADIVIYFLSNATTWRGETARRIKIELQRILKAQYTFP